MVKDKAEKNGNEKINENIDISFKNNDKISRNEKNKSNNQNANGIYNVENNNKENKFDISFPDSKEDFTKNKKPKTKPKIKSLSLKNFILYTLFYILFGNYFVFRNICLCGKGNQKIFIKLFILFTLISFFISQIFINIIISFIYIFKGSFRKFISHFYITIKKDSKKNNIFNYMCIQILDIFIYLFLGTFFEILFFLKEYSFNDKIKYLISFIITLISLPICIIIVNPILLFCICYKNKFNCISMKVSLEKKNNII